MCWSIMRYIEPRKDAIVCENKLKHHGHCIRRLKERFVESISDASCVWGKGEKAR